MTRPTKLGSAAQTARTEGLDSDAGATFRARKLFLGRSGRCRRAVRRAAASRAASMPCSRAAANQISGFGGPESKRASASYPATVPRDTSAIGWKCERIPTPLQASAKSCGQRCERSTRSWAEAADSAGIYTVTTAARTLRTS